MDEREKESGIKLYLMEKQEKLKVLDTEEMIVSKGFLRELRKIVEHINRIDRLLNQMERIINRSEQIINLSKLIINRKPSYIAKVSHKTQTVWQRFLGFASRVFLVGPMVLLVRMRPSCARSWRVMPT